MLSASLAACGPPQARPIPNSAPLPVAVAARLELTPLDVSPDGTARLLVRLHYRTAAGRPAHLPPGGQVDVGSSRGDVQWQPRVRYGDPAAIVRLTAAGPLRLKVTSDIPRLPHVLSARTDTRAWGLAPLAARALGPHAVEIGWFPRVTTGRVRIARIAADGTRVDFPPIAAPASTFEDPSVRPGAQYTYLVARPGVDRIEAGVGLPAELPATPANAIRGKAMWLLLDRVPAAGVDAELERAVGAGVRTIALRMCYGEYDELTPQRRAVADRFIDGAAARGITILAWTVPRAVTFEDLAANVRAVAYRTPAGNGPRGIAVDLERGGDFLGTGAAGYAALAGYLPRLRTAVGPHTLLIATVEDPQLEALTAAQVPYAAIAAAADVMQPMVYWRAHRAGASIDGMRADLIASYARLRELAQRDIPIDIGGQTASLGNRYGAPPAAEVAASIVQARRLGAIGEMFFDWDATSADQWAAIGRTPWK